MNTLHPTRVIVLSVMVVLSLAIVTSLVGCIVGSTPEDAMPLCPDEPTPDCCGGMEGLGSTGLGAAPPSPDYPQRSYGTGYAIQWERGPDGLKDVAAINNLIATDVADPAEVMKSVANRLSHLQQSPEASDQRARALFALMEAIDALEGTNDVSAPVPGLIHPSGE